MWDWDKPEPEGYDVGQVCMNGHPINGSAATMPQFNQDFCDKCGAKTITACPSCNTSIRGEYHDPDVSIAAQYIPPAYCYKCGEAFPWTEARIQAAIELIEEENLSMEDTETFKKSIDDIVRDTPLTQVGVSRFKKIMEKVGKETASAIRDILVDIVSEAAKKTIWGQ